MFFTFNKTVLHIVHIITFQLKVPIPKQRIYLNVNKVLTSQAPSKVTLLSPPYTSGPKLPRCILFTNGPKYPTESKAGQQSNVPSSFY